MGLETCFAALTDSHGRDGRTASDGGTFALCKRHAGSGGAGDGVFGRLAMAGRLLYANGMPRAVRR